jgi:hypothetical protein
MRIDKTVTFRLRGKPDETALESGRNAEYLLSLPGYVENVYCRLSLLGYGERNGDGVYLIANPGDLSLDVPWHILFPERCILLKMFRIGKLC